MALSQKHSGKMLVPWFNTNEWQHVKNLIYGPDSSDVKKRTALKILNIWKLRSPKLPSGVEGTLIILNTLMQLKEAPLCTIDCGAVIMRFLNFCCASGEKQGTFYKMAKQNDIPDWLIDLRHEIAHGQITPSRFMLGLGLEYCFDWLKCHYWDVQEISLRDVYFSEDKDKNAEIILELYCQFNLIQYSYKYEDLRGIDVDVPELTEKFETIENFVQIDLKDNLEVILKSLLDAFNVYAINQQADQQLISKCLLGNKAMFKTELYGDAEEMTLPNEFVMIWEDILNLLFKNKMLILLIKDLISVVDDESNTFRKMAGLWLIEIVKGLTLAKYICSKYNKSPTRSEMAKEYVQKRIKETIQNENAGLKGALSFSTDNYVNINESVTFIITEVMENPNMYTLGLLKRFQNYYKKAKDLTTTTANAIEKLLQTKSPVENADDDRPYKLDNLKSLKKKMGFKNILGEDVPLLNIQNKKPKLHFRLVTDMSIFEGCPLGVLKHQDRSVNPNLSFE